MKRKGSPIVVVCIGLVLMATSMLLFPPHSTAAASKTLKIGCLLTMTGWHSVFDLVEDRDLKVVAQMINDKGGLTIKGEKYNIELVTEDGKSTLDGITAAATRLTFDKGVKFVVGPNAFWSIASSPVFEPNKVLHVSGSCQTQPGEMDGTTPYGFLGHNTAMGTASIDMQALKKEFPSAKTLALVTPDDGALSYLVPKLTKLAEMNGYKVVGTTLYSNEMADYTPLATKINAMKADAVYMKNGPPQAGAGIIKALRQTGNNKPFVCSILTAGSDLVGIMGNDKEIATNVIALGLDPKAPNNPPMVNEILKKNGQKGPIFLLIPNALYVLTRVIQAADSTDPAVVKAKWESMDKVETLFGTGLMCGDQTYGIKHHAVGHPWAYQTIMDGKVRHAPWLSAPRVP